MILTSLFSNLPRFSFLFVICLIVLYQLSCRREKEGLYGNETSSKTFWSPSKAVLPTAVREEKFYKLFKGYQKNFRFEGSGVFAKENFFYVVFDNSKAIGVIESSLKEINDSNFLKGNVFEKSNYEGITFRELEPSSFYVMVESLERNNAYYPAIVKLDLELNFQEQKFVRFELEKKNKGLEGISFITRNGENFILGLCEGNFCNSDKEKTRGNGRIQVLKETAEEWVVVAEIKLPRSINFLDYSDMDIENGRIAIVSQVSSALWVGELHPEKWEILEKGTVYYFPFGDRDGNAGLGGEIIYCNIEGVSWFGLHEIVVVSDKRNEDQEKWCKHKEEMIHIFEIPHL
jgi:hypothetical protein